MVAANRQYHDLGDEPDLKIESMYAFVAEGPEGEGIMGATMVIDGQLMMMPMVGADMTRVKALYKTALEISVATGKPFKVYRFDHKVDITDELKLS